MITPNQLLWTIVIAYMAFVFVMGVMKASQIRDADDFLVAGRNVGWVFLFCTMGATVIGGGASVGAIGKTYDWGLLMLLVSMGWYLHFIFSGLFVAPRFREAELYTVAGYFGHRFGEDSRFVVLILSLLFSVFIVAAQMAAFGTVLSAILPRFADAELVLDIAILVGGIMVVIYSTAGGLLAVIHTDFYQFIVLLIGFIVTLVFCVPDIFENWETSEKLIKPEFFMMHGGKGWLFLGTTFLAFLLGETFAPGYATRYCVGKDLRNTRYGIAGVGLFLAVIFPVVLFGIALYARIHFPNIDPQQALPLTIKHLNHPVIGGLIIGALIMAVMSSADSALNSATAIFVKDLFEHQLGMKDHGDGRALLLARICTAALGGVAILIAILWSDIIDLLLFTYHVWAPAIIVPVCVGVFSRKRSYRLSRMVFITMVAATAATMIYRFLPLIKWFDGSYLLSRESRKFMNQFDPSVFGVLYSVLLFLTLHLLPKKKT